MYELEKKEISDVCKLLYNRNLVTAYDGNVSMRLENGHILITPSKKNKGFIEANEILVVDENGNILEGKGKISKELPIHKAIYKNKSSVNSVIHTHPVYATAFALAGKNIPDNLLIEYKLLLGNCGLAEYARPGSDELVDNITPLVNDNNAILLKNHGVITYGTDIMDAFNKMEIVESIAKTIIVSSTLGAPCEIPKVEMDKL